jgi:hypothetical protein
MYIMFQTIENQIFVVPDTEILIQCRSSGDRWYIFWRDRAFDVVSISDESNMCDAVTRASKYVKSLK